MNRKKSFNQIKSSLVSSAVMLLTVMLSTVLVSGIFTACNNGPAVKYLTDGSEMTVKTSGAKRNAFIKLPASIRFNQSEGEEYSLVFVLHGAESSADEIREISGFDNFSDRYNFIFVYPEGLSARWDSVTDNEFFGLMIDSLKEKYNIKNIYFTGFSAGAVKVFELGKVYENSTSAIAPVCGLLKNTGSKDDIPGVSILHIYSDNDKEAPMEGDDVEGYYSIEKEKELFYESSVSDCEFEEICNKNQGHVWYKKNADYIIDFFYNHPAKPARVEVSIKNDSVLAASKTDISGLIKYRSSEPVESIEVYSNLSSVYSKTFDEAVSEENKSKSSENTVNQIPFTFVTDYEGLFYLHAELKLKNGKIIHSTIDPYYISIRNDEGEKLGGFEQAFVTGVEASTCESNELLAPNCVDGVMATRWSSGWLDNQDLILDLGKSCNVTKLILFWEAARAREYDIYVSEDKQVWQKVYEKKDCNGGIEIAGFKPVKARYIKINFIKRATQYGFSLWEVIVLKNVQ